MENMCHLTATDQHNDLYFKQNSYERVLG